MKPPEWQPGEVPVAVLMISLNESHNMGDVLENLKGWAQEVFLVDSYSSDETVAIAESYGAHVIQRTFSGFGDQWNYAVGELPVRAPWTMKLDPDERLTDELKQSIAAAVKQGEADGLSFDRRLWFMGRPLPIRQEILRVWRTGRCRFTDVSVNEHPIVDGRTYKVRGDLEHHDSPDLHHWISKQNEYSTSEALIRYQGEPLAAAPKLFGDRLERRMWLKKHFYSVPFRYLMLHILLLLQVKFWRSGRAGLAWARQRVWVMRTIEDKYRELIARSKI